MSDLDTYRDELLEQERQLKSDLERTRVLANELVGQLNQVVGALAAVNRIKGNPNDPHVCGVDASGSSADQAPCDDAIVG